MVSTLKKIETETHSETVNTEDLQNLHAQMEKLITHNQPALKEIGAFDEAERVIKWIERCEEGSSKAERKLYQEGLTKMEDIKSRLHLAMEEQQRMEEESPSVASDVNAKGREAERFAKASGHASAAVNTLTNISEPAKVQN